MQVLFCRKCKKQWMHENRVWNDMPNSRQVYGNKCGQCGTFRDIKFIPFKKGDEEKFRRKVF